MTTKKIDIQEHFKVPEGYFENFTQQMMERLPEQEFQPMQMKPKRIMPFYGVAAAIILAFISIVSIISKQTFDSTSDPQAQSMLDINPTNGAYTVEDAADCAMINKFTMYEMITE